VFGDLAPVYMGYRSHRLVVENTGVAHFTEFLGHGRRIGLVALLGDAVHAMTPNIGQGAGMAMEDAALLAEELAANSDPQAALESYAGRRLPRVDAVMRVSREVGAEEQRSGALGCWLRNRRIRRQGRNVERALAHLERLLDYGK
jgi:2-polyprenyl-6-methoxyphenol hydroxylase-like FAD-dependent oxidoreductase